MKIEPTYTSVGVLFKRQSTFFIPKYQRAYAWESESVSDFIKDLLNCFEKRKRLFGLCYAMDGGYKG